MSATPDVYPAFEPAAVSARVATGPAQVQRYPLRFTGSGGEYFKIWIVNLLLTIATVGIYSAWAKVRKMQYFYRNTELDGSVFDYHGKPLSILKGRLIALALILFYNYSFGFSLVLGLIAALVFAAAWPWLVAQSLRFKLHNTSYRGLRFRFTGSARFLYLLMGVPLVAALALGGLLGAGLEGNEEPDPWLLLPLVSVYGVLALLLPWFHFLFKRYQHRNSAYGNAMGRFHGHARSFYWIYLQAVLMVVLAVCGMGIVFAILAGGGKGAGLWVISVAIAAGLAFYGVVFGFVAFIQARLQNYVWNNSLLGLLGFDSSIWARRTMFISVTNLLLIAVTLGFFTPFAAVRMYKYRVESVAVLSTGDLDGYVARQAAEVSATGEGAADLMDFDFSL